MRVSPGAPGAAVWLWMAVAFGSGAGCSGGTLQPASDGGTDRADPAACGCRLETDGDGFPSLHISWDCFCGASGCSTATFPVCTSGSWHYVKACELEVFTLDVAGGPDRWVFDSSGTLVGEEQVSDTSDYGCPSDPTNPNLKALRLRAGQFPDSTCPMLDCPCTDGGPACAQADGSVGQ